MTRPEALRNVSQTIEPGDLWVFGYGSLMWRPGFDFAERSLSTLRGFSRRLCVYSFNHRGTPEKPGLVMGLAPGGSCKGVAYRVPAAGRDQVYGYLTEREQITGVYLESMCKVQLEDGRLVTALAYLVDRSHRQYAGDLPREELLRLVRQGVGRSGPCPDYIKNTAAHLEAIGIRDATLHWLAAQL